MKTIELALEPIIGYLISIKRDFINGWFELEVGLPKNWVYDNNKIIECEVLNQSDSGKIVKISPKNLDVSVDDLISFLEIVIETNNRIAEKEKEFTDKMNEMKVHLESEAKKFYKELDELKDNSFKHNNDNFVKGLTPEKKTEVKKRIKANLSNKSKSETIDAIKE